MDIITERDKIIEEFQVLRNQSKTIGFVPTMGALHKGHLELVKKAKKENDFVVCSIFVNPLQFNKKEDFKNYPITLAEDKKQLRSSGCDYLFLPDRKEVFPEEPNLNFSFGILGTVMEGKYRPGHFEGMAAVIEAFFLLLNPDRAYFGEKDYQQLAVIKWLVLNKNINTKIVPCKTERNQKGLALSSRNLRLNEDEISIATRIFHTMTYCKINKNKSPIELCKIAKQKFAVNFDLEYFIIADENTLEPINSWSETNFPRVFVAANLSGVRLIDNLSLID